MTDNSFHIDLKGCVKSKGVLCIPLPELIKLFETFPYYLGKDFTNILLKANVSDKIEEVEHPFDCGCKRCSDF